MKLIRTIILFFIGICFASAATADWEGDYRKALNNGNLSSAVRIVQQEANNGNADAQTCLAKFHLTGQGVPQNDVEGLALLMVAAQNGSKEAKQIQAGVKMRMKPEHINQANEMAKNHRLKRN